MSDKRKRRPLPGILISLKPKSEVSFPFYDLCHSTGMRETEWGLNEVHAGKAPAGA